MTHPVNTSSSRSEQPSRTNESIVLNTINDILSAAVDECISSHELPSDTLEQWRNTSNNMNHQYFYIHRIIQSQKVHRKPNTTGIPPLHYTTPTVMRQYNIYQKAQYASYDDDTRLCRCTSTSHPVVWSNSIVKHAQPLIHKNSLLKPYHVTLSVNACISTSTSAPNGDCDNTSDIKPAETIVMRDADDKRQAGFIDIQIDNMEIINENESQNRSDVLHHTNMPMNGMHRKKPFNINKPSKSSSVYHFISIGYLRSCYKVKYSTPRQGSLCPYSRASFTLHKHISDASLQDIEQYSHLWLVFVFHENENSRFHAKVSPPKKATYTNTNAATNETNQLSDINHDTTLNGKKHDADTKHQCQAKYDKKVGVFASRTPHRYNPIGMTLVKLDSVERDKRTNRRILMLSGIDLIEGTPIIDIKPVHYSEMVTMNPSYTHNPIRYPDWLTQQVDVRIDVKFSDKAKHQLHNAIDCKGIEFYDNYDDLYRAIYDTLALDPRESYVRKKNDVECTWGFVFDNLNVIYTVMNYSNDEALTSTESHSSNNSHRNSEHNRSSGLYAYVLECQLIDKKMMMQYITSHQHDDENSDDIDDSNSMKDLEPLKHSISNDR